MTSQGDVPPGEGTPAGGTLTWGSGAVRPPPGWGTPTDDTFTWGSGAVIPPPRGTLPSPSTAHSHGGLVQ